MEYFDLLVVGYKDYANFLWSEITLTKNYGNWWEYYFYWLILVSMFFMIVEWMAPWRENQGRFRKDFWLDYFYMFFNFFLFSLIIYNGASNVVVNVFNDLLLGITGFDIQALNPLRSLPYWLLFLIAFVLRDFIQWWVHRLLHRVPFLWEFHKVHHSVEEMGFAAHLRFHWMENVVYRTLEYLPLALLGINLGEFFVMHIFTLSWGHFNHSNIKIWLGPLKYIFNNPQMHIWHHAKQWPKKHRYGINFGLTLSVWDYLFGTAAIPHDGRDIELGFEGVEEFPDDFLSQAKHGF